MAGRCNNETIESPLAPEFSEAGFGLWGNLCLPVKGYCDILLSEQIGTNQFV